MGLLRTFSIAADAVFPLACVECQTEGTLWCDRCSAGFLLRDAQHCPVCETTTPFGIACSPRHQGVLDGVVAVTWYANRVPQTLIRLWKYEYVRATEPVMSGLVGRWFQSNNRLPTAPWVVCSVPMHPRRFRERGFDQASILASMVAMELGVPYQGEVLRATRYLRKRQAEIENLEVRRARSFIGNFTASFRGPVPSHVILVDDVYTTGTTMTAVAEVLKHAGVKVVWGWAFSRGH